MVGSMNRRIYKQSPITEAVIDFRFAPRAPVRIEDLNRVHVEVAKNYPQKKMLIENEIRFQLGENPQAIPAAQNSILQLVSTDGRQVFQARPNGFIFSRLAPYQRWEHFRDQARLAWDAYAKIIKPVELTRTAIRFINRFDFPGNSIELSEYFTIYPQIRKDFEMIGLLLQVSTKQSDIQSSLVINQALVPSPRPGIISILVDFDLFSDQKRNVENDSLWKFVEALHVRMNDVFESSLTDKTRGLIA
jgi:uncharacterized protein (TIGR04255 family)